MRTLIIDGSSLAGAEQLHERFAAAFDFPDYYGGNLDALYDCLGDIYYDAKIKIINAKGLEKALGEEYAASLRRLLSDAENEFSHISVEIKE